MNRQIPTIDLVAQHASLQTELTAAIERVVSSGRYILGEEVEAFERAFGAYLGVGHVVGTSSGTAALQLALMAAGIGPGHDVITVSHTAVATVAAIEQAGANPVLVDIDLERFTLDPGRLAAALTPRTRAIVPVHLYGCPADLDPILAFAHEHGLVVIEDCAQAHGARYRDKRVGAWGHLSAFSFYPTKNLGAMGDGGAVATADAELATRLRELRQYGWRERYVSEARGLNARLDEIQAAILSTKLSHLDRWNARRRQLARRYRLGLANTSVVLPVEPADVEHVYHQFVIRSALRGALRESLAQVGIASGILYPLPVHRQPAYATLAHAALVQSERAAAENLALPLYPELTDEAVDRVCDVVRRFCEKPRHSIQRSQT